MSGDYISREAAIERATRDLFDGQTADYVAADIKEKLNAVPAADVVEVRHGRWHDVYMSSASSFVGTCSVCGISNDIPPVPLANYCPSCGAKMDDNVIQHTECVGNALGALEEVEELSRYIDANKMADELSKVPWYERKDEKQAVRMVKEFPTADVVEVVRCRDCENWDTDWVPNHAEEGQYFCPILGQVTDTDFYCGCGKRKDGGQDDV